MTATKPLWTGAEIAAATGGRLIGDDFAVSGLTYDSREIGPDQLFLALKGARDGHYFAGQAFAAGAAGALVDHAVEGGPQVVVGDTLNGLYQAWGLGNQHFPDRPGMRLVEGGGFEAVGHLGEAYGLRSVFALDAARGNGLVVLTGGSSADPELQQGQHSALGRYEERILGALHRHAISRPAST